MYKLHAYDNRRAKKIINIQLRFFIIALKCHTIYKILQFISELKMLVIYLKKKLIRNVKRLERTNTVAD